MSNTGPFMATVPYLRKDVLWLAFQPGEMTRFAWRQWDIGIVKVDAPGDIEDLIEWVTEAGAEGLRVDRAGCTEFWPARDLYDLAAQMWCLPHLYRPRYHYRVGDGYVSRTQVIPAICQSFRLTRRTASATLDLAESIADLKPSKRFALIGPWRADRQGFDLALEISVAGCGS